MCYTLKPALNIILGERLSGFVSLRDYAPVEQEKLKSESSFLVEPRKHDFIIYTGTCCLKYRPSFTKREFAEPQLATDSEHGH